MCDPWRILPGGGCAAAQVQRIGHGGGGCAGAFTLESARMHVDSIKLAAQVNTWKGINAKNSQDHRYVVSSSVCRHQGPSHRSTVRVSFAEFASRCHIIMESYAQMTTIRLNAIAFSTHSALLNSIGVNGAYLSR